MSTYAIVGSVGGLIFLLTMGYFFLMIFFPEWVGMSGEDTRKTMESHKEEKEED
jgi:hypothetical protein